jgi:hypothetical protein
LVQRQPPPPPPMRGDGHGDAGVVGGHRGGRGGAAAANLCERLTTVTLEGGADLRSCRGAIDAALRNLPSLLFASPRLEAASVGGDAAAGAAASGIGEGGAGTLAQLARARALLGALAQEGMGWVYVVRGHQDDDRWGPIARKAEHRWLLADVAEPPHHVCEAIARGEGGEGGEETGGDQAKGLWSEEWDEACGAGVVIRLKQKRHARQTRRPASTARAGASPREAEAEAEAERPAGQAKGQEEGQGGGAEAAVAAQPRYTPQQGGGGKTAARGGEGRRAQGPEQPPPPPPEQRGCAAVAEAAAAAAEPPPPVQVPVTLVSLGAAGGGATAVLGYVGLPAAAHRVYFSEVRSIIDHAARSSSARSAGGPDGTGTGSGPGEEGEGEEALVGLPAEYVFVRGGAPVGRKQEPRFTLAAGEGEPGVVVVRSRQEKAASSPGTGRATAAGASTTAV